MLSRELRLLDDLLGGPMLMRQVEDWIFAGDRAGLPRMQADGVLTVLIDNTQVPDWQLAAWHGSHRDSATAAALEAVTIDITDTGIREMGYEPRN